MGIYVYALNAPKTALSAADKTEGLSKAIGVLSYWYKPAFGWSDDPFIKRQNAMHNRTVGTKEAAWAKAGKPIPTMGVFEGDLKELMAGNTDQIRVVNLYGVCVEDDTAKQCGVLYLTNNGALEFEAL